VGEGQSESITAKIIIGKEEVAINFCYFLGSRELAKWQRSLPDVVFPALLHSRLILQLD